MIMAGKDDKKKKVIDFDKITKSIKNAEDKAKVDQIAPSVTDAYLSKAKYTDEKGVIHWKTKFDPKEAEELGDKIYNTLVYHAHRRYFDIDEDKYRGLLDIKDKFGNPYCDVVARHYFKLERNGFKNALRSRAENDEKIDPDFLQESLKDNIGHHVGLINGEITSELGPEDIDAIKAQIKAIIKKHKLDPKMVKKVDKIYDFQTLMNNYIGLIKQYYQEDEAAAA